MTYYELISNDHHNNNCALFKCWDSEKNYYKKVSFSEKGNIIVENEKAGYDWFFSQIGKENKTEIVRNYYFEIAIPEYKGNKLPYNYNFPHNTDIIRRIIKLYRSLWSNTDRFVVHGDFALSNIIYNSNFIYVIDWEHSHFSDKKYYGFDIIHLIFLTIYERINRISDSEIDFLISCYKSIIKEATASNQIVDKPFVNAQRYLLEFSDKFRLNIPVENKFVLAKYPQSKLEKLDLLIT